MANDSKAMKKSEGYVSDLCDSLMALSGVHGAQIQRRYEEKLQRERKFEVAELEIMMVGYEANLDECEEKYRRDMVRGNSVYYVRDGKIIRFSVEIMGDDDGCEAMSQASALMFRGKP